MILLRLSLFYILYSAGTLQRNYIIFTLLIATLNCTWKIVVEKKKTFSSKFTQHCTFIHILTCRTVDFFRQFYSDPMKKVSWFWIHSVWLKKSLRFKFEHLDLNPKESKILYLLSIFVKCTFLKIFNEIVEYEDLYRNRDNV